MKMKMKVLLIINRVESESNVEQPCILSRCFEQSARDVTC